jgi:hypothetical protein
VKLLATRLARLPVHAFDRAREMHVVVNSQVYSFLRRAHQEELPTVKMRQMLAQIAGKNKVNACFEVGVRALVLAFRPTHPIHPAQITTENCLHFKILYWSCRLIN